MLDFEKPKYEAEYSLRLSTALRFTEADLAANQQGFITDDQTARLRMLRGRPGSILVIIILVLSVVLLGIASSLVTTYFQFQSVYCSAIFLLIGGVIGQIALIQSLPPALRIGRDIRERRIASIEGRIQIEFHSRNNGTSYYARMNGKRFEIDKKTFLAFKNDDPYRLYYAPRSKVLLSAEWLRDDPFLPE